MGKRKATTTGKRRKKKKRSISAQSPAEAEADAHTDATGPSSDQPPPHTTAGEPAAPTGQPAAPLPKAALPVHLDRHIWEIQWFRDVAILAVVVMIFWLAYSIRAIVVPILLGLALAYVTNPLVVWAQRRKGVPRWASAGALLLTVALTALGLALWLVPTLISQGMQLAVKTPAYLSELAEGLGIDWHTLIQKAGDLTKPAAGQPTDQSTISQLATMDWAGVWALVTRSLGVGAEVVGSAVAMSLYFGLALFVTAFCYFVFSWKFDRFIIWCRGFIPPAHEQRTLEIFGRMDRSVAAFLRGRLVQAMVMSLVLSFFWWLVGVPYSLPLGLTSGLLNMVPFAASVGCAGAVTLTLADQFTQGDSIHVLKPILVLIVYLGAQMLDGWVVEPLVQGKATDLDPLTVVLAVLIGGALAGVLGLIVAIPVTACLKILAQEVILPRIRAWVAEQS